MKKARYKVNVSRLALVIGASLTVMAASAGPAFALTGSGIGVPNAAPTVMAQSALLPALPCRELPCTPDDAAAGAGGAEPGGRSDPGWGGSNHIGEGGDGGDGPDDPEVTDANPPRPLLGGRSFAKPN
jgi:hypothetical protein